MSSTEIEWEGPARLPSAIMTWAGRWFIAMRCDYRTVLSLSDGGTFKYECISDHKVIDTTWPMDELKWDSDELRAWAEMVWRMS